MTDNNELTEIKKELKEVKYLLLKLILEQKFTSTERLGLAKVLGQTEYELREMEGKE